MAADLQAVATAFVEALVLQSAARNAFYAAMHPRDDAQGAAVINQFAGGAGIVEASDITELLVLIQEKLSAASTAGGASISASSIMGEAGGSSGNIMPGDEGGSGANVMSDRPHPDDDGGTASNVMGDDEP